MNIMLFAPGLFIILVSTQGIFKTFVNLCLCALVQVVLALPFLLVNPYGYIIRSFDLSRVFLFKWTVNWRFLPEEVFVNPKFHLLLLFLHVMVLLLFLTKHWWSYITVDRERKGVVIFSTNYTLVKESFRDGRYIASNLFYIALLLPLLTSNFIGVAFSRSLHYQFYVWYFHSLPYLLWSTSLQPVLKIVILGVIELAWNTYPSTVWSSAALHVCHLVVMVLLWFNNSRPQLIKVKKTA